MPRKFVSTVTVVFHDTGEISSHGTADFDTAAGHGLTAADVGLAMAQELRRLVGPPDPDARTSSLAGLLNLLDGVHSAGERRRVQHCRPFDQCRAAVPPLRIAGDAEPDRRPLPRYAVGPLFAEV